MGRDRRRRLTVEFTVAREKLPRGIRRRGRIHTTDHHRLAPEAGRIPQQRSQQLHAARIDIEERQQRRRLGQARALIGQEDGIEIDFTRRLLAFKAL